MSYALSSVVLGFAPLGTSASLGAVGSSPKFTLDSSQGAQASALYQITEQVNLTSSVWTGFSAEPPATSVMVTYGEFTPAFPVSSSSSLYATLFCGNSGPPNISGAITLDFDNVDNPTGNPLAIYPPDDETWSLRFVEPSISPLIEIAFPGLPSGQTRAWVPYIQICFVGQLPGLPPPYCDCEELERHLSKHFGSSGRCIYCRGVSRTSLCFANSKCIFVQRFRHDAGHQPALCVCRGRWRLVRG